MQKLDLQLKFFYTSYFLKNLVDGIIEPLFVVYLFFIGVNPLFIGLVFAVRRSASLIFEIPTGILADKYGRKKSVSLSFAFLAIVFFLWSQTDKIELLLMLSFLWGTATALYSGSEESLIVDSLELKDKEKKRNFIFSRLHIIDNFGFFVGCLAGVLIVHFSFSAIWQVASLIIFLLFVIYLTFIKEKNTKKVITIGEYNKEKHQMTISDKLNMIRGNFILTFLLIAFLFSLSSSFLSISYPIFLRESFDFPYFWFSILGSLTALGAIIGAYFSDKVSVYFKSIRTMLIFGVVVLISLFSFSSAVFISVAIISFVLVHFGWGGFYPMFHSILNKHFPSEKRATLLSIISFSSALAMIAGELLSGFLLTKISPQFVLYVGALIFGLSLLPLIPMLKKEKK